MKGFAVLLLAALAAWLALASARTESSRAQTSQARGAARPLLHLLAPTSPASGTPVSSWSLSYRPPEDASTAGEHAWTWQPHGPGWRRRDGRSETTVGAYQRPGAPRLQVSKMGDRDDSGAAGASVSVKLGH